jgi:DNA (cytosine-5)-methyltransferase 1
MIKSDSTSPDVNREADSGIPIVSLFCGAGGLDLGFTQAGFKPVLAIDHDPAACRTFEHNHTQCRVIKRDLATASRRYIVERLSELPNEVSPVGVIGGPPCQAFSVGNVYKKAIRKKDGENQRC